MSSHQTGRRSFLTSMAIAGLAAPAVAALPSRRADAARQPTGIPDRPTGHGMVQGRFGAIHYRWQRPDRGTGKVPVLCLHASPGSGVGFTNFLRVMGTDRLILAADNPGFGLSDRPAAPSTIAGFAGAMSDLIDALGLTQVDLVGSHTGSATAVELARQRPDAVRRIVMHSAPLFTPAEVTAYKAEITPPPETLDAAADRLPGLWSKFARIRNELGDPVAWELFWEMSRDPTHSGWGHDAAFAYDFAGAIRPLTLPILVLNPQDGLHLVSARARELGANVAVTDLPWTSGLFSAHSGDIAPLIRAHFDR